MSSEAPSPPDGDLGSVIFRDRIKRIVKVPASSLKVNPRNWRDHPEYQSGALTKVLERIGFTTPVIARELVPNDDTQLEMIDGHLRRDLLGNQLVTVVVTDLDELEGLEALATHDTITSLATANTAKTKSLLEDLKGLNVPLPEIGWHQYKVDQYLAPPFVPNTAPATASGGPAAGGGPVSGEDLKDAQSDLNEKFDTAQSLCPVTCPHCAGEFLVRPADLKPEVGGD